MTPDRQTDTDYAALDLVAARAAIKQYRRAARRHTEGELACIMDGWPEWADEERRYAALTGTAALMERAGLR